jgi:phospholipid/cholesterol/gamma-HCH transport system substrate-binding protein
VLVVAVIAIVVILSGASSYTISARFANAGELVSGGTVDVGGTQIGSITGVTLANDGEARVTMSIDNSAYVPLHAGTRATVSAPGLAGVDNRFVAISPGPASAPALPSGSVLPSTATHSLVNFDEVLNALDPATRTNLQLLIAHGAQLYAGSGAMYFNRMLAGLDPALKQVDLTTSELSYDRAALRSLVQTSATTATALASRAPDLTNAVTNTARTLGAIAVQRKALAGILAEAPGVLKEGEGTLQRLSTTATALTPTLKDVPPAAGPLHTFLSKLDTTLPRAIPVAGQLLAQLPQLNASLRGFTALAPPTVTALNATGPALKTAMPILTGLRYYGSDFLLGVINGLAGISSGNYDAVGHYVRLEFAQPFQTFLGGVFGDAFGPLLHNLGGSLFGLRTHITAICPGGNAPPAVDGSSPWVPNPTICNPADDIPASVNQP